MVYFAQFGVQCAKYRGLSAQDIRESLVVALAIASSPGTAGPAFRTSLKDFEIFGEAQLSLLWVS